MRGLKKNFLFNTAFGVFVGKSFDARGRMYNGYESIVREYIINNFIKNQENENEVYCINIGANQGRWAIELAKIYHYNVIAFEPVPSIFNELMANIYLSGLSHKIEAYNYGIGNYDGTVTLKFVEEHEGMSHITKDVSIDEKELITIPIKKFDSLKLNIDLKNVRLILIDVEGHEYDVLQGMQETLKQLKNIDMIIEIFEASPDKHNIISLMEKIGFNSKQIDHTEYLFFK